MGQYFILALFVIKNLFHKFNKWIERNIELNEIINKTYVTISSKLSTVDLAEQAFENSDLSISNDVIGFAYDSAGNILYQLKEAEDTMRWAWQKVNK